MNVLKVLFNKKTYFEQFNSFKGKLEALHQDRYEFGLKFQAQKIILFYISELKMSII